MVPNRPINGHYPSGYQPYYQQAYQNSGMSAQSMMPSQQQSYEDDEIIITVKSENEIPQYPVAAGKTQLFLIAGTPTIWEKQMGQSLLEPIRYKKYKIVEDTGDNATTMPKQEDHIISEFNQLRSEVNTLRAEVEGLKSMSIQRMNASNVNMKEGKTNEQSFI